MSFKNLISPSVRGQLREARKSARRFGQKLARRVSRPNLYNLNTAERIGVVFTAPSDMRIDERMFLYSFVRGFRPERALEIGVLRGGGGCIMANAMQENGRGIIVGVDPEPDIRVPEADFHGRYKLLKQPSPQGLLQAREMAGGPFDFALIDGLHMYDQVVKDIAGVLPLMADGGYLLFHDAFHYGVAAAIREAVEANPLLHDCGYPCRTAETGDPITPYNGFRMIRFAAKAVADSAETVAPIYQALGRTAPQASADVLNHDGWYCRAVSPCAKCRANAAEHASQAVTSA